MVLRPDLVDNALSYNDLLMTLINEGADVLTLNQAMHEFNDLPFMERKRLTDRDTTIPPIPESEVDELVDAIRNTRLWKSTMLLSKFFVKPGPLTEAGNTKLVDCRALIDLLETGDEFERDGFKARSICELPNLEWIIAMSGYMKILRLDGRRIQINPTFIERFINRPLDEYKHFVDKIFDTAILPNDAERGIIAWLDNYLNINMIRIVANLYRAGTRNVDEIGEFAYRGLMVPASQESLDVMQSDVFFSFLNGRMGYFMWCLDYLGVVDWPYGNVGIDEAHGPTSVTVLGAVALKDQFVKDGYIFRS